MRSSPYLVASPPRAALLTGALICLAILASLIALTAALGK
jgi:hypothetical protein